MSNTTNLVIDRFVLEKVDALHQTYPTTDHQLITRIANLDYSIQEIHFIAKNMYHVVKNFPRFLSAITANIDDYLIRMPLVDNLFEEHGRMNLEHVHLQSYIDFLAQIGIGPADLENFQPCAGVIAYTRSVLDLCLHYPYLEGLAALGFIEDVVHRVSPIIGQTTKKNVVDLDRVSHFTEHEVLDEQHSQEIYALLKYTNEQEKQLIERGLTFGAYYHSRLYSDIAAELTLQATTKPTVPSLVASFNEEKLRQMEHSYPLAEGEAAVKRLNLLNNLYNKQSIAAIKHCIHDHTQHILEVGCGTGLLANQLVQQIDAGIQVIATDASQAQIQVAQATHDSTKNLNFVVCDGNQVDTLQQSFDIIYMRWVMVYQKNVSDLVHKLYQVLKPGGYLIIEDNNPMESGAYSHEQPDTIDQWNQFLRFALVKAGQTANLEKLIIDTYQSLSMQAIHKSINQCTLVDKEEKSVFYLGIEESKPRILAAGISPERVEQFIATLKTVCESKYPVDFVKNFQLIGRK